LLNYELSLTVGFPSFRPTFCFPFRISKKLQRNIDDSFCCHPKGQSVRLSWAQKKDKSSNILIALIELTKVKKKLGRAKEKEGSSRHYSDNVDKNLKVAFFASLAAIFNLLHAFNVVEEMT